jgi:hypothetical protein
MNGYEIRWKCISLRGRTGGIFVIWNDVFKVAYVEFGS